MDVALYQVYAFADGAFTGNPAAVCPLDGWLPDAVMQAVAAENNLSETAFFVPEGAAIGCAGSPRQPRSICAATRPWPRLLLSSAGWRRGAAASRSRPKRRGR
jgi:hypothetical protein